MAKSLRSKWKRKMKAEKRVRYGAKEKDRLLKMVEQSKKDQKEWDSGVITHVPRIPRDPKNLRQPKSSSRPSRKSSSSAEGQEEVMEDQEGESMDTGKPKPEISATSLRTKDGSYPVWVSNRKIQKLKNKKKKLEGKVTKQKKKKYL